jgi:hypothetical protein
MATKKITMNELKTLVKQIIKEESEITRDLSYHEYETPKISILWNGHVQPMGYFKSALDALDAIKKIMSQGGGGGKNHWQLRTPGGLIDIDKSMYSDVYRGGE